MELSSNPSPGVTSQPQRMGAGPTPPRGRGRSRESRGPALPINGSTQPPAGKWTSSWRPHGGSRDINRRGGALAAPQPRQRSQRKGGRIEAEGGSPDGPPPQPQPPTPWRAFPHHRAAPRRHWAPLLPRRPPPAGREDEGGWGGDCTQRGGSVKPLRDAPAGASLLLLPPSGRMGLGRGGATAGDRAHCWFVMGTGGLRAMARYSVAARGGEERTR